MRRQPAWNEEHGLRVQATQLTLKGENVGYEEMSARAFFSGGTGLAQLAVTILPSPVE